MNEDFYRTREPEGIIKHFLRCSITGEWKYFHFKQAFNAMLETLEEKLQEHAMLGEDRHIEWMESIGAYDEGTLSDDNLSQFTIKNNSFMYLGEDSIRRAIIHVHVTAMQEQITTYFEDAIEIYNEIIVGDFSNLQKNIELFDRLIHAEHATGQIYELDIDALKQEIEEEILV